MAHNLKLKGLMTYINELDSPDGALKKANNINIDEPNVATPRRGFLEYGTEADSQIRQLLEYKETILRHQNNKLEFDDGSGDFTAFDGTYESLEDMLRIKYQEANGNFYFTTKTGIKKISSKSTSDFTSDPEYITNSGGLKGLDIDVIGNGTLGFLEPDNQIAYRIVWGYKDANENLILGSPSARFLFTNTSTDDVNTEITIQIPEGATDSYFVQVYRTAPFDMNNDPAYPGTINDNAGDEMNLVDERPYDGITSPFVIIDETLNEFRDNGALLYTNEISGEGILQANDAPPIAKDIALFRNSMFYANTKTLHRFTTNLLTAQDLVGFKFVLGNINSVRQYTFVNTSSQTTPEGGDVFVDLSGSPAQDIDVTARELVKIINQDSSSPVNAFYQSTDSTLPGLILFENKTVEDVDFYLAVNDAAIKNKFNPELSVIATPTTSNIDTSTNKSDNEEKKNRVYFSKSNKPEAVPIVNYFDVGPADKEIFRIVALRDELFVLKEDGVYAVTGSTAPDFSTILIDESAPLVAPDTAAVLNNTIYCLSTQGIISVSSSGVKVQSFYIEDLIKSATTSKIDFKYKAFAVSYESDRSYLLWLPEKDTDETATQVFRYNVFTNAWTRWTKANTCGLVSSSDDKLYLGKDSTNYIEQERKDFKRTDFAEEEYEVIMLENFGIEDDKVYLASSNNVSIGDALTQVQYVTIPFFNRLLKKLDLDTGLFDDDYYSVLKMENGDTLRTKLQLLDYKLSIDANIGTFTTTSYSDSFEVLQTELNAMLDQLNSSITGTVYKDYRKSEGNTYFECLVLDIDTKVNIATVSQQMPFIYDIEDRLQLYKGIVAEIEWQPTHFGAPDKSKHIRDATVIFDQNTFYDINIAYQSDISRDFEDDTIEGSGNGSFGLSIFGENSFGGEGTDQPIRVLVPRNKQRCRYLATRITHINAREGFRIIGISYNPRLVSDKAYK